MMEEREKKKKAHQPPDQEEGENAGADVASSEMAALYALGALPEDEARAFEELLLGTSPISALELKAYEETLAQIARAVASGAPAPPPGLRERLLERVAKDAEKIQVWKSWSEPAPGLKGLRIRRASEGTWEETAVAGVSVKPLHVDPSRRYVTMLVRMSPGVSYPGHLHAGAEECFVLEGDLQVAGEVLRAGDYQRAEAGSEHGTQSTQGGCLLLIVSSQDDKILPA